MNITAVKVNFLKDFGELNEKRIMAIKEVFSDQYPAVVDIHLGTAFVNKETKKHILLAPGQISLGEDGINVSPNLTEWAEVIKKIFDSLLINHDANATFIFTSIFSDCTDQKMNRSLGFFTESKKGELLKGINGVGLRFFYRNDDIVGDIKIEPLLQDLTKWFIQMEVSLLKPPHTINQIFEIFEKTLDLYKSEINNFVEGFVK